MSTLPPKEQIELLRKACEAALRRLYDMGCGPDDETIDTLHTALEKTGVPRDTV